MKKSLLVIVGLMFLIVILGAVPTLNDVSLTPSSPLTNQNLTGSIMQPWTERTCLMFIIGIRTGH